MESPFRTRELAEKHRLEREADDARVRAEEAAAAEAAEREEARRQRLERQRKYGFVGGLSSLITAVTIFVRLTNKERVTAEQEHRERAAAVAAGKPVIVLVDPGAVRPSSDSEATPASVRLVVDAHADELARCFGDGLDTGELVTGHGTSHAFAFSWSIDASGAVSDAKPVHREPNVTPASVEACITERLRTWSYGELGGKTEVVAWMFEMCPTSKDVCVWPRTR